MKTINFNSFYKYFSNSITELSGELYKNGEIQEDFKFIFFNNSGEYYTTADQIEYEEDNINRTVLINILNNGGVLDSTVSIDTYLQMINFEVLALDEQRIDIMTLFTKFIANNKSLVDNLKYQEDVYDESGKFIAELDKNAAIQITCSDFPKYEAKFDLHGLEKFKTTFNTNIIVFPNAYLSNQFKLYIDGSEVNYSNVILSRNTETTPDLQKRDTLKFYPNTTGFQIQVSGLFVENDALNELLNDCTNNTKFKQTYLVSLNRPDGTVLVSDNFYCKDSRFDLKWGSIVNWQATFYLAEVIS